MRVYAVDTESEKVKSHADLTALAENRGSVPVTEIRLHDVSLDDVIKCMKVIHLQLISPHFPKLEIIDRADHPIQD